MDEAVKYLPTEKAQLFAARLRIDELERLLRHLDRHTLDLWLYVDHVIGTPNRDEWQMVKDLVTEVRDAYGLTAPDR
jgi:hypothetical protein